MFRVSVESSVQTEGSVRDIGDVWKLLRHSPGTIDGIEDEGK